MLEELHTASSLLNTTLNGYVNMCSTALSICLQEVAQNSVRVQGLLEQVKNQLELVNSYEENLHRARASLRLALNSTPTVAPINAFPPEIMLRIFNFVVSVKPGVISVGGNRSTTANLPKQPDILSHVCSRWRQIALSSPALWSHIDLAHHHQFGPGLVARAKEYAIRACHSPLDIHIVDPHSDYNTRPPTDIDDLDFLPPATRIRSLELVAYKGFYDSHFVSLGHCFKNCTPGQLEQLTIWDADSGSRSRALESNERPQQHYSQQVDISESHLEAIWAQISILRLKGVYLPWTSKAYHNLVDLRLVSGSTTDLPVSEIQIVEILRSSPRLRILHAHLEIKDPLPESSPVVPVSLDELEVLDVKTMWWDKLDRFIRWIKPGKKPLRLTIASSPSRRVNRFLWRSNVTRLRLVSPNKYSLSDLLTLVPEIHELVLDGYKPFKPGLIACGYGHLPPVNLRLQDLYILRSQIKNAELRELVERHSVLRVVIWDTEVRWDYRDYRVDYEVMLKLRKELPSCAVFTYRSDKSPYPLSGWDDLSALCC
ncbi:F-box-like domain containing protein [Ceratobasidium theobromae]|uniref:F-box-like domain containing protein n=1 Tax=Ceratobasidium theobromae TaxID=1582974 RepID=A0A5N5QBM8_9AGAM|nr:F-box-like domain containing protein [Ceratobasidium theobromae]